MRPRSPRLVALAAAVRFTIGALLLITLSWPPAPASAEERPFGTLRERAAMQQGWLKKRLDTFLPGLMRKHGIDMWVVPMREYNEDPVFLATSGPNAFSARRRTILVFFDRCAAKGEPPAAACVERIALGGSSQGGVYDARRSTKPATGGPARQAELWGDEQWQALVAVVEERNPVVIGIDRSTVFAFSDGLSSGELQGMSAALGEKWTARFRNAEGLPLELLAVRLPEEEAVFRRMQELVWSLTQEMFSSRTITPGKTTTDDLEWYTQHLAYVLLPGETEAPEGLRRALANANALQDINLEELRPGRTGNEVLARTRARMKERGIGGTVYSHPIGLHGHGAGPLIGLWDYQNGVPGRGDARVIPSTWFSIELQATTPVPEWGDQPVRMAQEEDAVVDADGTVTWARRRQDALFLVR